MKQRSIIIVSSVLVALAALICFFIWNHFHAVADYSEKLSENEAAQNQTQTTSQPSHNQERSEIDNNSETSIDVAEQTEPEDLEASDYSMEDDGFESNIGAGSEYILPQSASRRLTYDDIEDLSTWEIRLAANEILARHGRIFKTPSIREYFESQPWYVGTIEPEDFTGDMISDIEDENCDFLMSFYK